MSNCETVQGLIEQARDERLPALVQTALESHLASCPDCARLSVLEEQLSEGLSALRTEEAGLDLPAGFRRDVKERLLASDRNRPASSSRWASGFSAGLAAAACLVLVVVAVFSLRGDDLQPPARIAGNGADTRAAEASPLPRLDSRTAPLLYATPEVEVILDDAPRRLGSQALQPASASEIPEENETPRRGPREYHF